MKSCTATGCLDSDFRGCWHPQLPQFGHLNQWHVGQSVACSGVKRVPQWWHVQCKPSWQTSHIIGLSVLNSVMCPQTPQRSRSFVRNLLTTSSSKASVYSCSNCEKNGLFLILNLSSMACMAFSTDSPKYCISLPPRFAEYVRGLL